MIVLLSLNMKLGWVTTDPINIIYKGVKMKQSSALSFLIVVSALCMTLPVKSDPFSDVSAKYGVGEKKSDDPKINEFLRSEEGHLSKEFPYRINLFNQGQIAKNDAGVRASETANQIKGNSSGLVFFYELVPSAMRVPHWHSNANEIGTVFSGKIRVTIWKGAGAPIIYTVNKDQTWIIPKATLHTLENIGDEKTEFLVAYDTPIAADRDFVTAWASLPDEILARSVGLAVNDIEHIKKTTTNRLSKFEPNLKPDAKKLSNQLSNDINAIAPLFQSNNGSIIRLDAKLNPLLNEMILQKTVLKPGSIRIPHWYTSGNVLLYVASGVGYMTMMDDDGRPYRAVVSRGDLISVPEGNFHGLLNIGAEELKFYEVFNNAKSPNEITLMNGAKNMGVDVIRGTTNISKEASEKIMKNPSISLIEKF